MDTEAEKVIINLITSIDELITQAQVEEPVRQKARAILFFYLINPVLAKDPDFLNGYPIVGGCESTADPKWVPFLIHTLKTGLDLLKAELEILPEATELEITEGLPTPQELIDRFVVGLTGFYAAEHTNYHEMRSKLVNAIVNGVTHEQESPEPV